MKDKYFNFYPDTTPGCSPLEVKHETYNILQDIINEFTLHSCSVKEIKLNFPNGEIIIKQNYER